MSEERIGGLPAQDFEELCRVINCWHMPLRTVKLVYCVAEKITLLRFSGLCSGSENDSALLTALNRISSLEQGQCNLHTDPGYDIVVSEDLAQALGRRGVQRETEATAEVQMRSFADPESPRPSCCARFFSWVGEMVGITNSGESQPLNRPAS